MEHSSLRNKIDSVADLRTWDRAAAWLSSVANDADNPTDLLLALTGLWCCQSAAPAGGNGAALLHALALVENRLHEQGRELVTSANVNAKLLLLAAGMLSAHDYKVDRSVLMFTERTCAALADFDAVPTRYVEHAVLVDRLGYGSRIRLGNHALPEMARLPSAQILTLSRSDMKKFCTGIAAATRFGTARGNDSDMRLSEVLAVVTMQSLSEYDLDVGAISLRALNYLGGLTLDRLQPSVDFLIDQQCEDGSIGFFDIEVANIEKVDERIDPTSQLVLPITVSVLWTLNDVLVSTGNLFTNFVNPVT